MFRLLLFCMGDKIVLEFYTKEGFFMTNAEYENMKALYMHTHEANIRAEIKIAFKNFSESCKVKGSYLAAEVYVLPGIIAAFFVTAFNDKVNSDILFLFAAAIMGCAAWSHHLVQKYNKELTHSFFYRNEWRVVTVRYMFRTRTEMLTNAKSEERKEQIADFFEIALQDIPADIEVRLFAWMNKN